VPAVTALQSDPRGSGGFVVHLDGASFALLGAADVRELALAVGVSLAPEQLQRVEGRAEVFAARLGAMRILAYRALPSVEIQRRLVRKGHTSAAAGEAVGALVAAGLIDDQEFARHFVRTRARRFRYGPARLARDLRRLGIGEQAAQVAVRGAFDEEGVDAAGLLKEAAAKKIQTLGGLDPAVRRRRLRTYLLRRGFSAADVREVVKAALAG
jgi:regulatory protein